MSIPNSKILKKLFYEEDECINYLCNKNVFYEFINCPKCNDLMPRDIKRKAFRCNKRSCRNEVSIRKYTFFYGSHLNCCQILYLGYLWLSGTPHGVAKTITGHSKQVITRFYSYFRQLVSSTLEINDTIIGGPGIEVQIDESKIAKRKYNRGHRIDGAWVIGGVEVTEEKKIFLVEIEKRDEETLLQIICDHVHDDSIIVTDMWKAYSNINLFLNLTHKTVNHSKNFKDPITGACTNRIEATWNGLKQRIRPRNRTKNGIKMHITEFIWRRKYKNTLWVAFIQSLIDIHYEII